MKKSIAILVCAVLLASCNSTDKAKEETSASEIPSDRTKTSSENLVPIDSDEALVATALMAAPEGSRDSCKVIGFNMAGEFVTFREGTNEFVVIVDDHTRSGFNAACYHKDLEQFMARGRELRAEGKTAVEIFDIREAEAKSGELDMGKPGSTLHIYYGPDTEYDPETSKVENAIYRYVVYLPFATAESTGLPETPVSPNHPWIMNPGTHRAHIMISPVNE
jgi:hypothetical protein